MNNQEKESFEYNAVNRGYAIYRQHANMLDGLPLNALDVSHDEIALLITDLMFYCDTYKIDFSRALVYAQDKFKEVTK